LDVAAYPRAFEDAHVQAAVGLDVALDPGFVAHGQRSVGLDQHVAFDPGPVQNACDRRLLFPSHHEFFGGQGRMAAGIKIVGRSFDRQGRRRRNVAGSNERT
jgi:hypothetical protein